MDELYVRLKLDLYVRHGAVALWPRSAPDTHGKPTAVGVLHLRALIEKWLHLWMCSCDRLKYSMTRRWPLEVVFDL